MGLWLQRQGKKLGYSCQRSEPTGCSKSLFVWIGLLFPSNREALVLCKFGLTANLVCAMCDH